jgi:23S rRNA (guanosine2251-2'-O)-methyltransferase
VLCKISNYLSSTYKKTIKITMCTQKSVCSWPKAPKLPCIRAPSTAYLGTKHIDANEATQAYLCHLNFSSVSQVIYGFHPVVEVLQSGQAVEKVFIVQDMRGEQEKTLRALAKELGVPIVAAPREHLAKLVKGNHQGVVAMLAPVAYQNLDDVYMQVVEAGKNPLFLLLDHITDVRNFGAIARTAWVTGAHGLVVPSSGAAAMNEDAMKASAGALSYLPVCREKSLFNSVDYLKDSGVQIVATALATEAVTIWDVDFTMPTAIIMGSEGDGIQPKLLKMADKIAMIPQANAFDSLNVGVATGMMLYEAMKQRKLQK